MDTVNNNTESRKHKHLNYKERVTIQIRLNDNRSPYSIAKELGRSESTVHNEIKRGTVDQIKQGKRVQCYFADAGQAAYEKNRKNCGPKFKFLQCEKFIEYAIDKIQNDEWSLDACVGKARENELFTPSEMVCTKTFYSYVELGLLPFTVLDLPLVVKRANTAIKVRRYKRKLGRSIEERPKEIEKREEFGHWEIDTVIGKRAKDDPVILSLVERQTRNSMFMKVADKTAHAISEALLMLQELFGSKFDQVFKTITADNGSEFADLHQLELTTGTKVYFAHPYASYERGTNERHNGMLRRFVPKGRAIADFSVDFIAHVENWCNTLPRKILNYKSPEELFEAHLDLIYAP